METWACFVGFAQVLHHKDRFAERPPRKTVKLYNLSRVFKTDISAVLTVKSGLDPHRLEFQLQGEWLTVIMVTPVN
ncbi:hypothetical protein U9M48_038853 [Paspalum notatum var. saurae]|uniref:Uncharacterized protein n=1 Tax=Paspalum notatum var. saurae TaxID=547442 RepID=A0AAQ3XC29_PASNO